MFGMLAAGNCLCDKKPITHARMRAQIAPMEGGRINIQYRRVECTPPEPLKVNIHANVGVGGWLRIAVEVRSTAPGSLCEWPTLAKERALCMLC